MRKISSRAHKAKARHALPGNYKFFALVTLSVNVINLAISSFFSGLFSSGGIWNLILQIGCTLIIDIFYYLLMTGMIRAYMMLSSGQHFDLRDLIFAFSNQPEQIAIFAVVQFILQTAVINSVITHPINLLFRNQLINIPFFLISAFVILVIVTWIQLRLAAFLYLFNLYPYRSALSLMRGSWKLMKGNCLRLFYLDLSFLGIELLCLLSFGIGYLFAEPYHHATTTFFMKELCEDFLTLQPQEKENL